MARKKPTKKQRVPSQPTSPDVEDAEDVEDMEDMEDMEDAEDTGAPKPPVLEQASQVAASVDYFDVTDDTDDTDDDDDTDHADDTEDAEVPTPHVFQTSVRTSFPNSLLEKTTVPDSSSVLKTPKKRTASQVSDASTSVASFGIGSLHNTPEKKKSAETNVQHLQSALAGELLTGVWGAGDVPVRWLEVRNVILRYTAYNISSHYSAKG